MTGFVGHFMIKFVQTIDTSDLKQTENNVFGQVRRESFQYAAVNNVVPNNAAEQGLH